MQSCVNSGSCSCLILRQLSGSGCAFCVAADDLECGVRAAPAHVPLFGILMDELGRYFPDQRAVLYQPSALADGDTLERLLNGVGLTAIRLTRETRVHRFTSFEEYWQPFEAGGGRHGQLFLRLPAARQAVREKVRTRMAPFLVHGELEMQADVLFGSGQR